MEPSWPFRGYHMEASYWPMSHRQHITCQLGCQMDYQLNYHVTYLFHVSTIHPVMFLYKCHVYFVHIVTCPPMGMPYVTFVLPFFPIWKKIQIAIYFAYGVHLSPFKRCWKSLVELFIMATFASSFETF
jgi:hypothetical protein